MHSQLLQWINPRFGLQEVLTNWKDISDGLAEAKRNREMQLSEWLGGSQTS